MKVNKELLKPNVDLIRFLVKDFNTENMVDIHLDLFIQYPANG